MYIRYIYIYIYIDIMYVQRYICNYVCYINIHIVFISTHLYVYYVFSEQRSIHEVWPYIHGTHCCRLLVISLFFSQCPMGSTTLGVTGASSVRSCACKEGGFVSASSLLALLLSFWCLLVSLIDILLSPVAYVVP